MAHATIAILKLGPEGLFWNLMIDFCWLFPLAFHEVIFCIPGIALNASCFPLENPVAYPL